MSAPSPNFSRRLDTPPPPLANGTTRGFDEFYGFASGHWGEYFSPELERNGRLTRGDGYIIDDFTNHAIRFIEQNKDRPFFCYVPFNTPHSPMQVPDRFYDKFAGADLAMRARDPGLESMDMTRAALAMCENIDWNTGRILQALVDLDLAENTIVLYFCDNGPNSWRWNGEMKGRKGSTDEGGVRSPLLVRWPGRIAPGTVVPQIAAAIDLLPTLAELAGIPLEGGKPLDGRSLAPLLLGKAIDWTDRIVFSHWNRRVSARTQRWRLDSQGALFDMLADPAQDRNVAAEHPEIAARLRRAVEEWKSSVLAELERDDRPFTVGYPPGPTTRLPARDGVPHGNVKRSASAPNCSYFTNWTSERDRMTWDIDVATSGDYQASVYYACASEDVGSVVELRCGHSRIEAVVAEAHDPPLVGKEHDRASRGHESYVKDFKPMPLGVIRLEQGRAELILQAKKVAGSQAMDVRYIELTRLEGE